MSWLKSFVSALLVAASLILPSAVGGGAAAAGTICGTVAAPASPAGAVASPPVLAYYYQWFDPNSWNTKKLDYPLLGRYSSDDMHVMCEQVALAKGAGIDGFIVSWKVQGPNNRRLEALMEVARVENFKLAIIYQGLDVQRQPQPVTRVAQDLAQFRDNYGSDPVFHIIGNKPLVIWSGTSSYSNADLATVTTPLRPAMTMLGYAQSVSAYDKIAPLFDGNAYYWSSGDPRTTPGYAAKLQAMGADVHAHDGLWVAPFAPGFDARGVCIPQPMGGTKCGQLQVNRDNGATLTAGFAAAKASKPDVLGLISWNEFSENTYVEPSEKYGFTYLELLSHMLGVTSGPSSAELQLAANTHRTIDSSGFGSDSPDGQSWAGPIVIVVFAIGLFGTVGYLRRRQSRKNLDGRPKP